MRRKRQTYQLTSTSPKSIFTLDFEPATLSIQNATKFPVYVNIGTVSTPSSRGFTEVIAPFMSYVGDPAGATDYCIVVDNSSDPSSAFPLPVVIVFSEGGASSQVPFNISALPSNSGYIAKVLAIETANLIDFWTLTDVSGVVASDNVSSTRNGTYVNSPTLQATTFADNANKSPNFVSASSQDINIFTSSLASVFSKDEGSALIWVKLAQSDWTSATAYNFLALQAATSSNELVIRKSGANTLFAARTAQLSTQSASQTVSTSNWLAILLTWSVSNNRLRLYVNGSQLTGDQTGLSSWTAALASAWIASYNGNQQFMQGNIGMCALWSKELTATEALTVSTAP